MNAFHDPLQIVGPGHAGLGKKSPVGKTPDINLGPLVIVLQIFPVVGIVEDGIHFFPLLNHFKNLCPLLCGHLNYYYFMLIISINIPFFYQKCSVFYPILSVFHKKSLYFHAYCGLAGIVIFINIFDFLTNTNVFKLKDLLFTSLFRLYTAL